MAVRTLQQITQELKSTGPTAAQQRSINTRIGQLPGELDAQQQGLVAQKDKAFKDITSGARRRGLGFSGIPLAEQAEFSASNFAPALAQLQGSFNDRRASLEDALFQIQNQVLGQAIGIRESDLGREFSAGEAQKQRDFQAAQNAASRAASRASAAAASGQSNALSALLNYFKNNGLSGQAAQNALNVAPINLRGALDTGTASLLKGGFNSKGYNFIDPTKGVSRDSLGLDSSGLRFNP